MSFSIVSMSSGPIDTLSVNTLDNLYGRYRDWSVDWMTMTSWLANGRTSGREMQQTMESVLMYCVKLHALSESFNSHFDVGFGEDFRFQQ